MKLDYTLHTEGGSLRSREVGGHRFILFIHTRFNLSLHQLLFTIETLTILFDKK